MKEHLLSNLQYIEETELLGNEHAKKALERLSGFAEAVLNEEGREFPPHIITTEKEFFRIGNPIRGNDLKPMIRQARTELNDIVLRLQVDLQSVGDLQENVAAISIPCKYSCNDATRARLSAEFLLRNLHLKAVLSNVNLEHWLLRVAPDLLSIDDWFISIPPAVEFITQEGDGQYHLSVSSPFASTDSLWFGKLNKDTYEKTSQIGYFPDLYTVHSHTDSEYMLRDLAFKKSLLLRDAALQFYRPA